MTNNVIKTEEFLKDTFDKSRYFKNNKNEKDYRLEHTYRVANIGKVIAEKENLKVEAMIIACLLHDISYGIGFEKEEDWINHGRNSAKIARSFLKSLDIEDDVLEDICYGIAIHVDGKSDFEGNNNIFTESVSDADNIDRFDVYRIYENLQSNGFDKMSFEEKNKYIDANIEKLEKYKNEKFSTKTATEMWKEKVEFQILFLEKLKSQMDNSKNIV